MREYKSKNMDISKYINFILTKQKQLVYFIWLLGQKWASAQNCR